jgi:RNA polymerase sigma-70 factor (ECF subfamily)
MQIEQVFDLRAPDDTEASALEAITSDAATALIATLPRDQAEAVLLRVVMGLSADEAGRVLGKRAGAVRTAAYRGLRRLADHLEQPCGRTTSPRAVAPSTLNFLDRVTRTRTSTLKDAR